jgi:RNA polymerase sigma-70 factor, ECF subfamily
MKATGKDNAAPDFESHRNYLKLQAEMQLSPRLKVKEAPSDIVQQAMLEAHRDLRDFRGKTDNELRAWLRMILTNNLAEVARRYNTQQRTVRREVSLQEQMEQSSAMFMAHLDPKQETPSKLMMTQERSEKLAEALLKLRDEERTAVVFKHIHNMSVAEIAEHLGRTSEAVAGLLRRGLKKLRDHLSAGI